MSLRIDSSKCTGCGACIIACPKLAITIHDGLAMIDEDLCVQCGTCANLCPFGAIREVVPAYEKPVKGGEKMTYGYGRGFGRGGAGFGFRGSSPPWPYYGRGRGGLPRRWYPGAAMVSPYPPAQPIYAPKMTPEGEIDWLKSQAEAIRTELNQTEARIHDLGTGK